MKKFSLPSTLIVCALRGTLFLGAGLLLVQPCAGGFFITTGSLTTARTGHTATLLPNGQVLVAGGFNGTIPLASAELYDPASGTWTATGSLATARTEHLATLLLNGKVLVAGGFNFDGPPLANTELYDPASGTWTATGNSLIEVIGSTETLLPAGKVLVAGGSTLTLPPLTFASSERYDPASGNWTGTGGLNNARTGHTATLLTDGRVLVAGGANVFKSVVYLASAELYDPASGVWTATGCLTTPRTGHTATLLTNGQVLIAGGFNGTLPLASAELYDPATTATTRLLNISTRLRVLPEPNELIGGFIVTGTAPKKAILRAIGPSLSNANPPIAGALADPTLELHQNMSGTDTIIVTNDNWIDSPDKQAIIDSTVPPTNDLESAIIATLQPYSSANPITYTAVLRGSNNTTGVALVEGYDLDPSADSVLGNISTRGFVDTGDNVLIGGIITGSAGNVLIRAIGPSLLNFGIQNPLQDPALYLHDGNGDIIASNDNWKESNEQSAIAGTGISPTNDNESAIFVTLVPGNYTAIVSGISGGTGVGLIEVYPVP